MVHKNRGRVPPKATPETIQQRVVALTQERYLGINHTQLTELLAEREDTRGYLSLLQGIIERRGVPMRCTPMGMLCSSPGVFHRTYPRFPGKGHQPNGAGPWESWGSPRYWPTAPMPKEGWSGPR